MKQHALLAVGLVGFLSVAACHKVTPVASRPASPVPVATANSTPAANSTSTARTSPASVASNRPAEARRSSGLTAQDRATLNDRLARLEDALFDYDKATIRTDATTVLKDDVAVIRGILANYPSQKLMIQGNADERGSAEYNLALGDKRAGAADEFLTVMGIPAVQLTVISYGKERPVCTDSTESCWQRNRRVHITAAP
jgi:peptidoglycan-associated lipoprotein